MAHLIIIIIIKQRWRSLWGFAGVVLLGAVVSGCGARTPCPQTLLTHKGCQEISKGIAQITHGRHIDHQLRGLLDDFKSDADFYGLSFPDEATDLYILKFDDNLANNANGLCKRKKVNSLENSNLEIRLRIFINPALKSNLNALRRTAYHEFGHCFFDRRHDDRKGSLMHYTNPFGSEELQSRWHFMVADFFSEMQ